VHPHFSHQTTDDGYNGIFKHLFLPFGLIKGYGKVRGEYKDTALIHVAHHLLIFLGPRSPFLNRTEVLQERYQRYHLPSRVARGLFSCQSKSQGHEPECGRPLGAQNRSSRSDRAGLKRQKAGNRYPQQLVEVVAGGPMESCDIVCKRVNRQCFEWGAIYAQMATHVRLNNVTVYRPRMFEPCLFSSVFGPMLPVARSDLPTMNALARPSDPIRLGSVRLFRCDVPTSLDSRRVCPCFNNTVAALHGSVGLFSG
jgi:hypothetical protein